MTTKKILLVEDNSDIADMVRLSLSDKSMGRYELLWARTLNEAFTLYDQNEPQIVIVFLDGSLSRPSLAPLSPMPETLPFLEHLRQRGFMERASAVAISGNPNYQAALLERGCNGSAPKHELIRRIDTLVSSS